MYIYNFKRCDIDVVFTLTASNGFLICIYIMYIYIYVYLYLYIYLQIYIGHIFIYYNCKFIVDLYCQKCELFIVNIP